MPTKLILLNGGSRTRRAFMEGATVPVEAYRTKTMIAHIESGKPTRFVAEGAVLNFTGSAVFTRLRAEDALFCGILYEELAHLGVPASDPITLSFPLAEEKIAQMARFTRAGLMVPKTIIASEHSYAPNREYIFEHLSFPLVYKEDGSRGDKVSLLTSEDELHTLIAAKAPNRRFILQELIPNTFDTRTLVAYGTILGSISRTAAPGQFHNNVAKGGTAARFELSPEAAAVAIAATRAARLDFGGVDLIHTDAGPVILEVNKSPQIGGFESVFGENVVFRHIAAHLSKDT